MAEQSSDTRKNKGELYKAFSREFVDAVGSQFGAAVEICANPKSITCRLARPITLADNSMLEKITIKEPTAGQLIILHEKFRGTETNWPALGLVAAEIFSSAMQAELLKSMSAKDVLMVGLCAAPFLS